MAQVGRVLFGNIAQRDNFTARRQIAENMAEAAGSEKTFCVAASSAAVRPLCPGLFGPFGRNSPCATTMASLAYRTR